MSDTTTQLPPWVCDLLASPPKRGEGLNNWLFRRARVLHAFRGNNEIIELLRAATFGEAVKHGEIERQVQCSRKVAWERGQSTQQRAAPAWPKLDQQQRATAIAPKGELVDLWEASPIRFEDDQSHTEEIIDVLFPDNPLLCCGWTQSLFDTRPREEWRGRLSRLALIVPSPMTARTGRTKENKISAHTLETTGQRRFLVVEQDTGDIDDQAAVLLHLSEYAPLVLAVHSGGKSIHGWFACRAESETTFREFMRYAVTLGADSALWTRSQFARMPDGRRAKDTRQTVFYFDRDVLT
jgi:hypothetical protein